MAVTRARTALTELAHDERDDPGGYSLSSDPLALTATAEGAVTVVLTMRFRRSGSSFRRGTDGPISIRRRERSGWLCGRSRFR